MTLISNVLLCCQFFLQSMFCCFSASSRKSISICSLAWMVLKSFSKPLSSIADLSSIVKTLVSFLNALSNCSWPSQWRFLCDFLWRSIAHCTDGGCFWRVESASLLLVASDEPRTASFAVFYHRRVTVALNILTMCRPQFFKLQLSMSMI